MRAEARTPAAPATATRTDGGWLTRSRLCPAAFLFSSLLTACSHPPNEARVAAVDLTRRLQDAERRPATAPFELGEFTFAGQRHATIVAPAESRLTWRMPLPRRGTLQLFAAVPSTAA